jgi:hypothetical protein
MSQKVAPGRAPARVGLLLAVGLLAVILVACASGTGFVSRGEATPTKTRRPTFTPLPGALTPAGGLSVRGALPPGVTVEPADGVTLATGSGTEAPGGDTSLVLFATETPTPSPTPTVRPATVTPIERAILSASGQPTPFVVVKPADLNGRRGPGTDYDRIGQAKQGQQLFILGRTADNAWYQVCCLANQPVWVAADQVEVKNSADIASVLTPPPTAVPVPPTPRPAPVVQPQPGFGQSPLPTPGPVGTPLPPFDIARGPEFPIRRDDGRMTIWVKVYEGPADNERPLGGYILKVFRNGVDISDNLQSFGDREFDKTSAVEGGYAYNLKFEKYEASEADWEIYLARPGGFRVSPITKFTTKGDSYRNLVVYIAYLLAR